VARLPRPVSRALGHTGAWLAWRLMPRMRTAVAGNLSVLFPGERQHDLERRALLTIRAYASDVVDFIGSLDATDDQIARLCDVVAEDGQLFRDLLAQGRGIILVTGHYGNWEIGGVIMRRLFRLPLTVVAMAEVSEEVNRMRREIRDGLGIDTIEVRQSLDTPLRISRQLRDNGIVAMLMDRHVDRDRVEVAFLGRTAAFLRTPALMGYMTGAPLVPCFIERTAGGRFSVRPGQPIVVSRDLPRDDAMRQAAQRFADQLASHIRAHPQYWYQFYAYWESQPPVVIGPPAGGPITCPPPDVGAA
jgi:KDO2-lipid IV(A) lauroyltransferase